jgi:hypothetical protein
MIQRKVKHTVFLRSLRWNRISTIAVLLLTFEGIGSVSAKPVSSVHNRTNGESVESSLVDERVLLKTDREMYLCGENICFTAFTVEGNLFLPVSLSSVLYVELYSQDYRVISKGKFFIKDGRSSGKILIPRTISTDIYYLRAYTRYMQNFGDRQFFLEKVRIVNPFYDYNPDTAKLSVSEDFRYQVDTIASKQFLLPPPGKINVETEKKNFGNREKVNLFIHSADNEGKTVKADLSLFVTLSSDRNENGISYFEKEIMTQQTAMQASPAGYPGVAGKSALKYLPETRGDILSGRLLYRDKQPAGGVEVLQSFTGRSACVESCITGKDGSFMFFTDDDKNTGDLILKAVKPERETIFVLDEEFYPEFTTLRKEVLHLTREEIDLIRKQFVNIQVDDAFASEIAGKPVEKQSDAPAFYGDVYKEYRFSDYAKLPNMREFIFEIIEGVVSARENRQEAINILDERAFDKIGPNPLIIIDGVPVSEASVVTGLDPEKVQVVRVVRNKYFYKKQIFDGILDIITYQGDASAFDLPEGTFRFDFMREDGSGSGSEPLAYQDTSSTIPVYKNMLCNKPLITTDDNGDAEISFMTPDNSGTYVIECFGLTPEGIALEGRAAITVGEKNPK